jgi:hypothetical protein
MDVTLDRVAFSKKGRTPVTAWSTKSYHCILQKIPIYFGVNFVFDRITT